MKWRFNDKLDRVNNWQDYDLRDLNGMAGMALCPMTEINGYMVRPGFYRMHGSYQTDSGVSFTINSHGATSCELLLFRPHGNEPFAVIPIPEEYRIGDTYSILVYGLKMHTFEYAYRFDGPKDPERGIYFDKNSE